MTRKEMVDALLERGWSRDGNGDLRNVNSIVLLASDGAGVACTDHDRWPLARVATPDEAFRWATECVALTGPIVRVA